MPPRSSQNGTGDDPRRQPNKGAAADGTAHVERAAPPAELNSEPFWQTKSLEAMSAGEWESLCDRCGRCCMVKLEDEDTAQILKTDIACKLFDEASCSCIAYASRQKKVADCIKLTPQAVREIKWLPSTCAYRLVSEGRPLEPWHPLVSGSYDTVHAAGISMRGRIGGSEKTVKLRDYVDHIVEDDD
jgi:uncharacterized cysteine cluster protein YcgN (CxxCxxCC family)